MLKESNNKFESFLPSFEMPSPPRLSPDFFGKKMKIGRDNPFGMIIY